MFGITMNRIIDGEYKDIPRMAIREQYEECEGKPVFTRAEAFNNPDAIMIRS